jgi:cyclopropane-fatty-acyl-phospholipid synthase
MHIPSPIAGLLELADITVNGDRPWDIHVHDERLFRRVLRQGSMGLGESYMDGWWDCERLDEFFSRILRVYAQHPLPLDLRTIAEYILFRTLNLQTLTGARAVAEKHYNLGNDFYETMLDPYMQYSCGYFLNTTDLATAQEQKLDLICRKLQLKKGITLLDIGCGWGGLARFAAERYGVHVTGINISTEQIAYARQKCEGLPVEIRECDYRKIEGTFDRVVSVGMFEHVGDKNYRAYMKAVRRAVKPDGLALIHTIGTNKGSGLDPWIEKYIFPHSMLPAPHKIVNASEGLLKLEDWHNFGAYYDPTLMAWFQNFTDHWPSFKDRYGERFRRMWTFYLMSCAGSFRSRNIQLWQLVFSPYGVPGGYQSVR